MREKLSTQAQKTGVDGQRNIVLDYGTFNIPFQKGCLERNNSAVWTQKARARAYARSSRGSGHGAGWHCA
jgi:hypothetical protein